MSQDSFTALSALDDATTYLVGVLRGNIELDRKTAIRHALNVANQLFSFWDVAPEVLAEARAANKVKEKPDPLVMREEAASLLEALSRPHVQMVDPIVVSTLLPLLIHLVRGWLAGKN